MHDPTLTRFKRSGERKRAPVLMPTDATRTRYLTTVKRPEHLKTLLSPGFNNQKIGGTVRKGKFKGYKIFGLSLEERITCPTSCLHWRDCYGNNMPFAKRVDHTDPTFLDRLRGELSGLCSKRAPGVLVRLHVLGDFYSVAYVEFWRQMLETQPKLAAYGYTARHLHDPIGRAITQLTADYPTRFMVRFSDGDMSTMSTVSIEHAEDAPADAIVCPEQLSKVAACGACALCWHTPRNIAFVRH